MKLTTYIRHAYEAFGSVSPTLTDFKDFTKAFKDESYKTPSRELLTSTAEVVFVAVPVIVIRALAAATFVAALVGTAVGLFGLKAYHRAKALFKKG